MGLLTWMRKRRSLILGVSMLVGVAMLSGCGGNKGGAGGKTGDTLYIGMTNAPDSFNPLFNPGIAGQFAIRFMYDTLLGMPEPNKFTPQLAECFESQDNQNFTIKINDVKVIYYLLRKPMLQ